MTQFVVLPAYNKTRRKAVRETTTEIR